MDATNPSHRLPLPLRAPMHIAAYALAVRDLARMVAFYSEAVGFATLEQTAEHAILGVAGAPLLHLTQRPDLRPDDPHAAGLFHTAFIMPTRADLADWCRHAQRIGLDITRTGDHLVNEAIYYDDPEGNGCECYSDRPPETWDWDAEGHVDIDTGRPVDLAALMRDDAADDGGEPWRVPAALRIGHINLRVGDTDLAERFYSGVVGFDFTGRRSLDRGGGPRTITFMSSGRYHHHFAANDFFSQGAGRRAENRAGLDWFAVELAEAGSLAPLRARLQSAGIDPNPISGGIEFPDPWGTSVRVMVGETPG